MNFDIPSQYPLPMTLFNVQSLVILNKICYLLTGHPHYHVVVFCESNRSKGQPTSQVLEVIVFYVLSLVQLEQSTQHAIDFLGERRGAKNSQNFVHLWISFNSLVWFVSVSWSYSLVAYLYKSIVTMEIERHMTDWLTSVAGKRAVVSCNVHLVRPCAR